MSITPVHSPLTQVPVTALHTSESYVSECLTPHGFRRESQVLQENAKLIARRCKSVVRDANRVGRGNAKISQGDAKVLKGRSENKFLRKQIPSGGCVISITQKSLVVPAVLSPLIVTTCLFITPVNLNLSPLSQEIPDVTFLHICFVLSLLFVLVTSFYSDHRYRR